MSLDCNSILRIAVGDTVAPAPHDLYEICLMYRREADHVIGAVAALATARGVPVEPAAARLAANP